MKPSINPNPNPNANRKVYNYGKIEGAECTPLYPANKGKRDVNLKNTDIVKDILDLGADMELRDNNNLLPINIGIFYKNIFHLLKLF